MNILVINVLYCPIVGGGAEIVVHNLNKGLRERGHQITVLTFSDKDSLEEELEGIKIYREKIPNIYLPYFRGKKKPSFIQRRLWHFIDIYNLFSEYVVKRYLDKIEPDIVVCHNIPGWSPSIWFAVCKKRIPLVQVLHDQYLLCPTSMFKNNKVCSSRCLMCSIMRHPHKILSNNITAVVGVSKFILNKLVSYKYFASVPIKRVIYNSMKIDINDKVPRSMNGYISIGFVGTISPNKGIELLLQAYLKIKSSKFKLYIAGSGDIDYVNYLKTTYEDSDIIWMGWVKPEEFFEKIDVTVVPSIWEEVLPTVVIESFAYGVPVIASKIGGIPEMIEEKRNGMLFEAGNYEELASKILEFSKNIDKWKKNYLDIQKSAEKFFNYDRWIDEWEKLLNEANHDFRKQS